jgi:hypothetical protein
MQTSPITSKHNVTEGCMQGTGIPVDLYSYDWHASNLAMSRFYENDRRAERCRISGVQWGWLGLTVPTSNSADAIGQDVFACTSQ